MAQKQKHLFSKKPLVEIYEKEDREGKQVEFREDSEQGLKYQEILNALSAAGYYRAQVQGITPFDKIVGGMTWCIEYCDVDIDINLLFEEDLTIGKKIALTEKIVAVLPSLKCPHSIEPHQIQGLDYINILPVIQWLIKHSHEFRQENDAELKRAAIWQYNKYYIFESDRERFINERKVMKNLAYVQSLYKPTRIGKRKDPLTVNELEQVTSTLSEYDQRMVLQPTHSVKEKEKSDEEELNFLIDFERTLADPTNLTIFEDRLYNKEDESSVQSPEKKIHYAILQSELMDATQTSDVKEKQKYIQDVEKHKLILANKENELLRVKNQHEEDLNEYKESIAQSKGRLKEMKQCLVELFSVDDKVELNQEYVKRTQAELKSLVRERNELLQIIAAKKSQCSKLDEKLKELREQVRNPIEVPMSPEEIEAYDEAEAKLTTYINELRPKLTKLSREVTSLSDTVDDIPTQSELLQYEKRFLQLYEQVAVQNKDVKKLCCEFNTRCDIKSYMNKEITLLNSIIDNFNEAMSTSKKREQFLTQLEHTVESIHQTLAKTEKKHRAELAKSNQLSCEYLQLQDIEKEYLKTLEALAAERKQLNKLLQ